MVLLLLFFRKSLFIIVIRRSTLLRPFFLVFSIYLRSCFSFFYRFYIIFLVRLAVRLGFRRARLGIFVGINRGSRV